MDPKIQATNAIPSPYDSNNQSPMVMSAAANSALGNGEMISRYGKSLLVEAETSSALKMAKGFPRLLGGYISLATSGAEIAAVYRRELNANSETYPETRKTVFVNSTSIAAGLATGALAGATAAAATALGAPIAIVGAIGLAGVAGVGYTAYKAREWAEEWWAG